MDIVIVDDDKLVSSSLKTIIESTSDIKVYDIGNNGQEAIDLYDKYKPDILLMDIRMDVKTGIDAAREILAKYKDAKILLLTTFQDDEYIIEALKIGVRGYILKQNYTSIVPSLKAVFNNQNVFGSEIVSRIPNLLDNNIHKSTYKDYDISNKEFDIIKLVSEGLSNKEIATNLFLSEGTVRNYISNILDKLELRDRTQLAIFYFNKLK